jgi:PAT family beta-lactamase induction signal transducer AmpG
MASGSGYAAASLGWPLFFLMTTLAAVPTLALLFWLQARGHFASFGADRRKPPD